MSVFGVKTGTGFLSAQAPPQGELVATTPLGRDENGKNLVAYIIRTDEEAGINPRALNNANGNAQNAKAAAAAGAAYNKAAAPPDAPRPQIPQNKNNTSARFVKPDALLSRLEQEQLDQLRARDAAIHDEAAQNSAAPESLLTSFVYDKGPDGKRYAVGVSAPLIAQNSSKESASKAPPPLPSGTLNPYVQASLAYRHSSNQDASGPKAGLLDKAL